MNWLQQETLADGRKLWQLNTPLAREFVPGLQLAVATGTLPILRTDDHHLFVVAAAPVEGELALTGLPLAISEPHSLLLVCHDDGLFAALAWLFRHRRQVPAATLRLLAHFSRPLPFRPQPSRFLTPMLPAAVTAALPLLDDWQVVSRISHPDGLPGCFDGDLDTLIAAWQRPGDRVMVIR